MINCFKQYLPNKVDITLMLLINSHIDELIKFDVRVRF